MRLIKDRTITSPLRLASLLLCGGLAACAGGPAGDTPRYRCEAGVEFTARFVDDSVVLDGSRGYDVLYRDAGGVGQQTVYSNPRMRAEFGLGPGGREAIVRYPLLPLVLRCVRS
ncbi:MAG: hypothetical protein JWQ72_2604 [Polaromonas sp.]|nr:hypothetical protein [Polaromonas sp.]